MHNTGMRSLDHHTRAEWLAYFDQGKMGRIDHEELPVPRHIIARYKLADDVLEVSAVDEQQRIFIQSHKTRKVWEGNISLFIFMALKAGVDLPDEVTDAREPVRRTTANGAAGDGH